MNAYFDTDVILAGCVESHSQHRQTFELFRSLRDGRVSGVVLAHELSEMYSVLTKAPFVPRISPGEAWQLVSDRVLGTLKVVQLEAEEHAGAVERCAEDGWAGGRVFAALHLAAARKAQSEKIYTFNVRHFRQLAPDLADIIVAP